jgi:hypothetical protein
MALKNTDVHEGYRRRSYPENRARRESSSFRHVDYPEGRTFAIMVQMMVEQMTGGATAHVIDRDFKGAGIDKDKLFRDVVARMPEYNAFYRRHTGKDLTPHIVYMRWYHKAVYTNGKPGTRGKNKPAQSREHYTCSVKLRPHYPVVEQALRSGEILTLAMMASLGGGVAPTKDLFS